MLKNAKTSLFSRQIANTRKNNIALLKMRLASGIRLKQKINAPSPVQNTTEATLSRVLIKP